MHIMDVGSFVMKISESNAAGGRAQQALLFVTIRVLYIHTFVTYIHIFINFLVATFWELKRYGHLHWSLCIVTVKTLTL